MALQADADANGPYFCEACTNRYTAGGDCPSCVGEPLLDLRSEDVVDMVRSFDEQRWQRRLGVYTGLAAVLVLPALVVANLLLAASTGRILGLLPNALLGGFGVAAVSATAISMFPPPRRLPNQLPSVSSNPSGAHGGTPATSSRPSAPRPSEAPPVSLPKREPEEDAPFAPPYDDIARELRSWLRSGQLPLTHVQEAVCDWAPDMHPTARQGLIDDVLAQERRRAAEWERPTAAERIEQALRGLHAQGIHYRPAAGFSQQEAIGRTVAEAEFLGMEATGVVTYSHQDLEGLLAGAGLTLRFAGEDPTAVGRAVEAALQAEGVPVHWSGHEAEPIRVDVPWQLPLSDATTDRHWLLALVLTSPQYPEVVVRFSYGQAQVRVTLGQFEGRYPGEEDPTALGEQIGPFDELLHFEAGAFVLWSHYHMHPSAIDAAVDGYLRAMVGEGFDPEHVEVALELL